jgi:hypothetical protein
MRDRQREGTVGNMPLDAPGMTPGTIGVRVLDSTGAENQFIQAGQPFTVELNWRLNGAAVAFGSPAFQWHVRASLESIGPGPELPFPETLESFVPTPGHAYQAQINATAPATEGLYELAVRLDLRTATGARLPAHGFEDGIQVDVFS